jgi:hypothetical protein
VPPSGASDFAFAFGARICEEVRGWEASALGWSAAIGLKRKPPRDSTNGNVIVTSTRRRSEDNS